MNTGIYFNNSVNQKSVRELRQAINDILNSGQEQKTLQKALAVLGEGVKTGPMHVSNVDLKGDDTHYNSYYDRTEDV